MFANAYLAALKEKHASLDQLIWDETQRSWPNEVELKRMKWEKLRIKDKIERLEDRPPALAAE